MASQSRPVWVQYWNGLKPAQRVGVAALAALFMGGLAVLAATSGGDGMVRLVQGGKPDVLSALAASGIRFETRADGVYVPRHDHERAVVQLLACGTGDRELFEGVFGDWLGTRDTREKKFQIALQEKLRAMIRSFDGVEDARVQITPAEPSQTLAKAGIPAKASVFVTLRKGRRELTSGEARGIANLVAGAVRGLEPKNVAVADPTGRTYDPEGMEASVSDFFGEQRKHEQALEEKVRRHLAHHYPTVIVSAFVRLSRRSVERRTSEQTHSAQGPQKGPDDDVSSERPHWKGATSPDAEGEPIQTSQRRMEERENILPGEVERASISITIPVAPGRQNDPVEWISTTVSKATGIPTEEITVKLIPFVPEPSVSAPPVEAGGASVGVILPGIGGGAVALAVVALAWTALKRRRAPASRSSRPEAGENELREFVRRRLAGNVEHGARVLGELGAERAAVVLSLVDDETAAKVLERVARPLMIGVITASARLRERPAAAAGETLAVLTQCAEALVIPR